MLSGSKRMISAYPNAILVGDRHGQREILGSMWGSCCRQSDTPQKCVSVLFLLCLPPKTTAEWRIWRLMCSCKFKDLLYIKTERGSSGHCFLAVALVLLASFCSLTFVFITPTNWISVTNVTKKAVLQMIINEDSRLIRTKAPNFRVNTLQSNTKVSLRTQTWTETGCHQDQWRARACVVAVSYPFWC